MEAETSVLTPEHPFIAAVLRAARAVYGERLRSLAIFGSVARRTARPDSDLDLLLVLADLPRGRRARLQTFEAVERALAPDLAALADAGLYVELSPVLRTPDDLKIASPLLLDLTDDAVVLEDRSGVLAAALENLRCRLRRLGARRIWTGTSWYWDLKPDYRRGEIFEL
jgi:hypothetical protein